jgi:toxin ParE1/3/4
VTLEVRVEAEASADLVAAIEYYLREAGSEVAMRFVEAAEAAFSLVARHPAAGHRFEGAMSLRLQSLRVWPMKDYPYSIYYEADERTVRIYSVVHSGRDVEYVLGSRFPGRG